jgi:hypothetical protein
VKEDIRGVNKIKRERERERGCVCAHVIVTESGPRHDGVDTSVIL